MEQYVNKLKEACVEHFIKSANYKENRLYIRMYNELESTLVRRKCSVYEKTLDFGDDYIICLSYGNKEVEVYIEIGDITSPSIEYYHTNNPDLFYYIVNIKYENRPKTISVEKTEGKLWKELDKDDEQFRNEMKKVQLIWIDEAIELLRSKFKGEEWLNELIEERKNIN